MYANDLTDRWVAKTLTREHIYAYLAENVAGMSGRIVTEVDLQHVVECCYHLYQWSTGQLPGLGDFLTAVTNNDLMKSVQYADSVNMASLWIYAIFLYNVAPAGWNKKDGGEKGEEL